MSAPSIRRSRVVDWRTCVCGCGRVFAVTTKYDKAKGRQRKYATRACFYESAAFQQSRRVWMLKRRKARFGQLIERLKAGELKLHEALMQVYEYGYQNGYQCVYRRHTEARKGRAA